MTTGTMQLGGFVATGAARPGVCPTTLLHATAQAGAPVYATTWLDRTNAKPESWAFGIDRDPRPWESFL